MVRIGIIYMVTGVFCRFWQEFHTSCEAYFCIDAEKGYEVFTDSVELTSLNIPRVSWHLIEDRGWTENVSPKSEFICSIRARLLSTYDYVFYLNGNLHFLKSIAAQEILPDASTSYFTVLSFNHYMCISPDNFGYERNEKSQAYIPYGQGKRYYQGGFYGGRVEEILRYSEWSKEAICSDRAQGIIACHHDESYLNRYLLNSSPRIINDKYGYCSYSPYRGEYKAEFLDKDAFLGVDVLRARDILPASLIWLQGDVGDQMFGLALCYYLQSQYPEQHFYPSYHLYPGRGESLLWDVFPLGLSVDNAKTIERQMANLPVASKHLFREKQEYRKQQFEKITASLTIYQGRWQCWQYADACAAMLKKAFTLCCFPMNGTFQKRLLEIQQSPNAVSVHIPAVSTNECEQLVSGNICTSDYYEQAMEKMRILLTEEPEFFFFRDDELGASEEERWRTMLLISACKHHIIANNSISWWGAWLSKGKEKIVIAPDKWRNTEASPDIYPQSWIKIPILINKNWLNDLCRQWIWKSASKKELGLYEGKMGDVLLFFHCARSLDNSWYEEYAEELLDEIYSDINQEIPVCFFNGLCGIGWGIEYLVQHGFVKGCTDDILADLDKKVMEIDPRRMEDSSYETGIQGIMCYVHSRLASPRSADSALPFDSLYLAEMKEACLRLGIEETSCLELPNLLERISVYYSGKPKQGTLWHLILKILCI